MHSYRGTEQKQDYKGAANSDLVPYISISNPGQALESFTVFSRVGNQKNGALAGDQCPYLQSKIIKKITEEES